MTEEEIAIKLRAARPEYQITKPSKNAADKWGLHCTVCHHNFIGKPSVLWGKRKGVPCKCSPSYRRTEDEWEDEILAICTTKGYEFLGFSNGDGIDKYNKQVTLYCNKHNHTWTSRAKRVLAGIGCDKCGHDSVAIKNTSLDTAQVVTLFKERHGDRFDYSEVDYINWKDDLKIHCPEHGYFYQRYRLHLQSTHGCPSCTTYGFKPANKAYLYVMTSSTKCKVGITNNNPLERLHQINISVTRTSPSTNKYFSKHVLKLKS